MNNIKKFTKQDRYGNMMSYELFEPQPNVPPVSSIPRPEGVDFKPKGTDTVPAMLTPGENVVNAEASRKYQPMIDKMNDEGRTMQAQQGGPVPSYASGGGQVPMYAAAGMNIRDFLKEKEGVRNEAYRDSGGVLTIGAGSTDNVTEGQVIDDDEVNARLEKDLDVAENDYDNLVKANLNPNQKTAVTSLIYNIGGPNFAKSKALEKLNSGDYEGYLAEMREFRMANGEVISGLENRRAAEAELFKTAYTTPEAETVPPQVVASNEVPPKEGGEEPWNINRRQVSTTVPPVEYDSTPTDPTFMSADAATTDNVPKEDTGGFFDPVTDYLSGSWDALTQGVDSIKIKNQRQQAEEDKITSQEGTWFSDGLKENQKELDAFQKEIREKGSKVTQRDVDKLKKLTEERDEAKKIYEENVAKLGEVNKPTESEIEAKKRIDEINGIVPKEDGVPPKIEGVSNVYNKPIGPEQEKTFMEKGMALGEKALGTIGDWFVDTASGMFSGELLGKAVVSYAGSRAMGYNHEQSFNHSLKTYGKDIEGERVAANKYVTSDDATDKFTAASLQKYRKTRDMTDLIPRSSDSIIGGGDGSRLWLQGYGAVEKVKVGKDKYKIRLDNGNLISLDDKRVAGLWHTYDDDQMDAMKLDVQYAKDLKGMQDSMNGKVKKDDDTKPLSINIPKISQESTALLLEDYKLYGVKPKDMQQLKSAMAQAQDMYLKQQRAHLDTNGKVKPPLGLAEFYQQTKIKMRTSTPGKSDGVSFNMVNKTSNINYQGLDKKILNGIEKENPNADKNTQAQMYREDWQQLNELWAKATSKQRKLWEEEAKEVKGWNGFTWWANAWMMQDDGALKLTEGK